MARVGASVFLPAKQEGMQYKAETGPLVQTIRCCSFDLGLCCSA